MTIADSDFFTKSRFLVIPGIYVFFNEAPIGTEITHQLTVTVTTVGMCKTLTANVEISWTAEEFANHDSAMLMNWLTDRILTNLCNFVEIQSGKIGRAHV